MGLHVEDTFGVNEATEVWASTDDSTRVVTGELIDLATGRQAGALQFVRDTGQFRASLVAPGPGLFRVVIRSDSGFVTSQMVMVTAATSRSIDET